MTATTAVRLLDAALTLLDSGGPASVRMRDVGQLAGVSHNAAYKHWSDKEQLLAAVATRELQALTTAIRRRQRGARPGRDALTATATAYIRWASRHPARFKLVFSQWTVDDPLLAAAAHDARSAFQEPFNEAESSDLLTLSAARAASLVWASAHGAVDLELSGHLGKDRNTLSAVELITVLVGTITNG